MKRLLVILIVLLLTVSCGLGEQQKLVCPWKEDAPEALLAGEAAALLSLEQAEAPEEDSAAAVNLMLGQPDTLLCDTQSAMLLSLQGYTAEDLRTAMTPVCQIASCPLYFVVGSFCASTLGIDSMEGFLDYINAHEYELLMGRYTDASVEDCAAADLSDALPLLTDYYFLDEIIAALEEDELQAAVLTGTDLTAYADTNAFLPLMSLGSERTKEHPELPCAAELDLPVCIAKNVYLLASAKMPEEAVNSLTQRFLEGCSSLTIPQSYEAVPLTGEALQEQVKQEFAKFKRYMTAEGLFFY